MGIFSDFIDKHSTDETYEEYEARDKFVKAKARSWLFGKYDDGEMSLWKEKIVSTYYTFAMGVLTEYLVILKLANRSDEGEE